MYFSRMEFKSRKIVAREKYPVYSMFFTVIGRKFFTFYQNFHFWRFYGIFSLFFRVFSSLSLYWPQVTPFYLQTTFLACRFNNNMTKKEGKNMFWKFTFLTIEGHFWQFLTIVLIFSLTVHSFWKYVYTKTYFS